MPDHEFIGPRSASSVPHVGTYRRVLPVSLERLYENALDWEHLPHLHRDSFADIRCEDAGAWGWRARTTLASGTVSIIELTLDRRCRRWISRTFDDADGGAVAEIWTQACPVTAQRVDVVIDFFVAGVEPARRRRVGEAYARLYERLYDEDVAMMRERQRQLDRRLDRAREVERHLLLGPRPSLQLPMAIVVGGREFLLVDAAGTLAAIPRQCPHQLGPLGDGTLAGRVVTCPWHGDRFDVVTGENLSGRQCRLSHLPEVAQDEAGRVSVTATH